MKVSSLILGKIMLIASQLESALQSMPQLAQAILIKQTYTKSTENPPRANLDWKVCEHQEWFFTSKTYLLQQLL